MIPLPPLPDGVSNKAVWWVVAIIASAIIVTNAVLYTSLIARLDEVRDALKEAKDTMRSFSTIQQARGERISALESGALARTEQIVSLKSDIEYIKRRVDEIAKGFR